MSIASGDVPRMRHARRLERARQLERRLPAELHDHAFRLLALHDLEHVLERQRLEVQLVRRVEVGRDGLRIRVDHDRLVTRARAAPSRRARSSSRTRRPGRSDSDRCRGSRRTCRPSAAPRSPRRSCRRGTASPTGTRRRRCRPSCTPAARSSAQRRSRTSRFRLAAQRRRAADRRSPCASSAACSSASTSDERGVPALRLDQLAHLRRGTTGRSPVSS